MRDVLTKLVSATVFLTLTMLVLVVTPALAEHVQCGDVITQDTTLDSDLVGCVGVGLKIGADDVDLDLNGHVISAPSPVFGGTGISNADRHERLAIRNGTVKDYAIAIDLGRVIGVEPLPPPSTGFEIRSMRLEGQSGIQGFPVRRLVIREVTTVTAPLAPLSGSSSLIIGATQGEIIGNTFDSPDVRSPEGQGIGADARLGLDDSVVARNVWRRGGLVLVGRRNHLVRNSIIDSYGKGIAICTVRCSVTSGAGPDDANHVERNVIRHVFGGAMLDVSGPNHVERNVLRDTTGRGIVVFGGGPTLVKNTVEHALSDGIQVNEPGATLTKNRSDHNGDFGIEAVPGTIDGGGNKASGNGNPLQCLNVFCK